ncbi:ketopantoate reductase family protein [Dysgonomonas sp. ZJ709]|uniref:ketopantoate reductase family protein n=1 Tax=Dysgonomonas sp. ZJ709 TaxID=2709797 RepID=UPI0013ECFDFD|nr:ketopantoate reductase family protein [Dysgonomonas sp. ZJ709]
MNILIYGAGTIGCTYGWQLAEAGHDVSILVREGKKQSIEENGINIHCTDYRGGQKRIENIVFRPKVIEVLSSENNYEYIIVSVGCDNLKSVLPILSESAGKAHILFFQNMWNDFDEIAKYLSSDQYFFGFPFMVGGGRGEKGLNAIISDSKYSKTILGEANGDTTPRIQKIAKAMGTADLKPFISNQIITWLVPHFAFIAGFSAGVIKAGGTMKAFTANSEIIKEAIRSVREGFLVCSKSGINPKMEKVNKLYYLPLWISVPVVKKIFGNEAMCLMFDGYLKHSKNEIKKMLEDILEDGKMYNVEMPYLKRLQKSVMDSTK